MIYPGGLCPPSFLKGGVSMSQGRLFEIVNLLLEKGKLSAGELAERFEVSVRTIYRDVDALSAAGVPIYATPGRTGGVALLDRYVLSKAALTEEEQSQLLTALRSLSGQPGLEGSEALAKLSALFRRTEPDWLQVDLSHWGDSAEANAKFQLLKSAILNHRIITFSYVSSYGIRTRRQVLPAKLVFKGRAWYLQGFCLDKEAYRTFRLSRMLELSVTERTFAPPLTPPPIQDSGGNPPMVSLRLRFASSAAYRVYDEFDETQITPLPDGSFQVVADYPEDNWVYGFLLSFGSDVEILSPDRVRRQVGCIAKGIFEKIENHDTGCQDFHVSIRASQTKEDATMNERIFCQSCAMPMDDPALRGTEADGTPSPHYCKYCYEKGAFTQNMTMEEMIDFCAVTMAKANPGMSEEQAKAQMRTFFPKLLRWKEKS